jgi:chromosome segregation ATPase
MTAVQENRWAKPRELIKSIISQIEAISGQVGDIDDLNEKRAKAEHNLGVFTHNLKIVKMEFAETEAGYKKLQREVDAKFAERDRLTAEIRELTARRDQIAAELQRLRSQFGG